MQQKEKYKIFKLFDRKTKRQKIFTLFNTTSFTSFGSLSSFIFFCLGCLIVSFLSSVFYRDNGFTDIRRDGSPFSIELLKYVRRILLKFPLDLPDNILGLIKDNNRESIINCVKFGSDLIKMCHKRKTFPKFPHARLFMQNPFFICLLV